MIIIHSAVVSQGSSPIVEMFTLVDTLPCRVYKRRRGADTNPLLVADCACFLTHLSLGIKVDGHVPVS